MKEIKYILHAFLLLFTGIFAFICLKAILISTQNDRVTKIVLIDDIETTSDIPIRGKELFIAKCGSCHIIGVNSTGPPLCDFELREPWNERENVYQWIHNPREFMKKNTYALELKETYSGTIMTAFPDLTNEEIDEIINYINAACGTPARAVAIAEN